MGNSYFLKRITVLFHCRPVVVALFFFSFLVKVPVANENIFEKNAFIYCRMFDAMHKKYIFLTSSPRLL